jgi:PAS domain-containing protein
VIRIIVINQLQNWVLSNWIFVAFSLVILILLYGIRRYEKNRQWLKHEADKTHFMEGILHNTPFALAITDNQGRINIINNVFQSLFGYSKDEKMEVLWRLKYSQSRI